MIDISEQKKQLRKQILDKAKKLEESYKTESSKKIIDFLISTKEYKNAKNIFCFVGMKNEVDTKAFIENSIKNGKTLSIPYTIEKGIMVAKKISSLDNLHKTSFGTYEPSSENETIEPQKIDICILPCVSCSNQGIRLGYGGGFYDRYMLDKGFIKICLCFGKLTNQEIPKDKFDVNIDYLITEKEITKFI